MSTTKKPFRQTVMVYGLPCELSAHGRSYVVRHPSGLVLARAMTRLLAIARAAIEVCR